MNERDGSSGNKRKVRTSHPSLLLPQDMLASYREDIRRVKASVISRLFAQLA
jgi:hypothetical protein